MTTLTALAVVGGSCAPIAAEPGSVAGAAARPVPLLPDLRAQPPFQVTTRTETVNGVLRQEIAFGSKVDNIGRGPLIVDGIKATTDTATDDPMTASQAVLMSNGTIVQNVVPNLGKIFFYPDHYHWHLLPFETYELRVAGTDALASPAHKAGFCLGDRYQVGGDAVEPARHPRWAGRWSCDRPLTKSPDDPYLHITHIREGISVGWGDDYVPVLEGQVIDVTGVAAGRYYLINRVSMDHRLMESDASNNAASLLVRLSRTPGSTVPSVNVLATCPLTARCDPSARPVLIHRPSVTGAVSGGTARCTTGRWKGRPTRYYFQWFRGGYPRRGATQAIYRPSPAEKFDRLTCRVTAANSHDATVATSPAALIRPPKKGARHEPTQGHSGNRTGK